MMKQCTHVPLTFFALLRKSHIQNMQKLDTGKAGAISDHMLKHAASAIAPSVTELFNHSICTGQLPKDWKVAYVVPIPKWLGQSPPQTSGPYPYCHSPKNIFTCSYQTILLPIIKMVSAWGFQPPH